MVFLNWKSLPVAWWGFDWFPYAMLMVVLVPGLLALAFGWFAFRSRVTGVYLSIITQAMTFALYKEFFRNDFGFGGNNGLTDFKDLVGFPLQSASTKAALFSASAIALILAYVVARAIIGSKYGKALMAIRDAESRMRFLGYRVENYKLFAFVVSAVMAGVGGALYVPQVGIINPSEFAPANSIEAAIWVAVGGRATLVGAAIGAIAVNFAKTWFTGVFPEYLALRARRAVRAGHAVPAARPARPHARRPARDGADAGGARARRRGGSRPMTLAETSNPTLTSSILYLDGISVSFDGYKALRGLSLMLAPGEMRAIIGPNGAGKTTMMDVITGKTRPDEGEAMFDGKYDLTRLDEAEIADARHRPKIPEADRVREPHGRGQPAARRQGAAQRPRRPCSRAARPTCARPSTASSSRPASGTIAPASRGRCRTGRSNGSRSACCSRRTRSSSSWTSRSPA